MTSVSSISPNSLMDTDDIVLLSVCLLLALLTIGALVAFAVCCICHNRNQPQAMAPRLYQPPLLEGQTYATSEVVPPISQPAAATHSVASGQLPPVPPSQAPPLIGFYPPPGPPAYYNANYPYQPLIGPTMAPSNYVNPNAFGNQNNDNNLLLPLMAMTMLSGRGPHWGGHCLLV